MPGRRNKARCHQWFEQTSFENAMSADFNVDGVKRRLLPRGGLRPSAAWEDLTGGLRRAWSHQR